MVFEVTVLGNSSATPTVNRHPSAQVVNFNERLYLIDCGEGTQMQLLRYRIKFQRINHIFISHLHGDHFFGLMGFLSTMHLQGRTNPLHLFGNPDLFEIIQMQLKVSDTQLRYPLEFHPMDQSKSEEILEESDLKVKTIPLKHRIPCTGFLFQEKPRPYRLIKERLFSDSVPLDAYPYLKEGKDYSDSNGRNLKAEYYTMPPLPSRSFAYCSDTIFDPSLKPYIEEVDLLYHEATFDETMGERAAETFHSTAAQAGRIARDANVKKLIIGHFSARYKDLNLLLEEARKEFPFTSLALEGEKYPVSVV